MNAVSPPLARTRGRERVLYTVLLVVAVLLYVDPLYTGFGAYRVNRDVGPLKYVVALLSLLSILVDTYVLSLRGRAAAERFSRGLTGGWAVFAFATMAAAGSVYARVTDNITDNFLQLAIASVTGFTSALLSVSVAHDPDRLVRRFFKLLVLALLYVVPTIAWKRLQGGQAFHTEIFLVLPVMGWAAMSAPRAWQRAAVVLGMLFVALCLHKNIGYLTLAITLYVVLGELERRRPPARPGQLRLSLRTLFAVAVACAVVAILAVRLHGGDARFVPSGSVEVRGYVYRVMLHRFLENPLIGDFYSSSALIELPYMEVLGNHHVTAHSDWLDALAHGGLVGAGLLFFATVWQLRHGPFPGRSAPRASAWRLAPAAPLASVARPEARPPVADARARQLATLWVMGVSGVLVSAFVSMLSALPIAFLFWTALGSYVGIRLRD